MYRESHAVGVPDVAEEGDALLRQDACGCGIPRVQGRLSRSECGVSRPRRVADLAKDPLRFRSVHHRAGGVSGVKREPRGGVQHLRAFCRGIRVGAECVARAPASLGPMTAHEPEREQGASQSSGRSAIA